MEGFEGFNSEQIYRAEAAYSVYAQTVGGQPQWKDLPLINRIAWCRGVGRAVHIYSVVACHVIVKNAAFYMADGTEHVDEIGEGMRESIRKFHDTAVKQ